ncbi:MAG: 3-keto-5-aminohexanoate cleavage protein [Chloroflexi bacterium]|nr:3-keto-5-aminohexanoate cleavage protein [Chloroflexota bacterium]
MDKLIITCATAWDGYENVAGMHLPRTARETADSLRQARDAGAAVAHVHEPYPKEGAPPIGTDIEAWLEVAEHIRESTDIVYEHGQGGVPYFPRRLTSGGSTVGQVQQRFDLRREKPEMIAYALNALDFVFGQRQAYSHGTREEFERDMRLCRESGVKPAMEVWHGGSFFNFQWLVDRGLLDKPYWLTCFFGGNGGMAGPATIDELLARVKLVPPGGMWQVAIWSGIKGRATTRDQLSIAAHAIALGGHVRVGMEDNPYYWDGIPAESNAQIVERIAIIARQMGREVASPNEAREMLGLSTQGIKDQT